MRPPRCSQPLSGNTYRTGLARGLRRTLRFSSHLPKNGAAQARAKRKPRPRGRGLEHDYGRSLFEGGRDRRERGVQVRAQGLHCCNDCDRDTGRDKAVFDGSHPRLILQKPQETCHVGCSVLTMSFYA